VLSADDERHHVVMRFAPASVLVLLTAAHLAGEDPTTPTPSVAPPPQDVPQTYDPLRGMNPDGSIPQPERPADLPNPDRWRYLPEGRLKPGNVVERFMVSSFIAPIVYYDNEVGAGGGLALTDIDFREQRRREFAGIFAAHSTKGQEDYALVWQRWTAHEDLPEGGILQEERSWVRGSVGYNRVLTRRFYGFGPDSPDSAETSYTDEEGYAQAEWQTSLPRPGDDTVLSLGATWQHHNLASGHVSGRPSTWEVYPDEFAAADDNDSLWLTFGLAWDTRDSQANPYRGWTTGVTMDTVPLQSSGRFGAIGTWRTAVAVPVPGLIHGGGWSGEEDPPTDVLAVGGFLQWTMGELPFFALPSLGGPYTLRAYIADRFTDRAAWHASAEYRFWVIPRGFRITDAIRIERLGLAPFIDLGTVAHDVPELARARVHQSYGIGMRAMLERAAVFRCDLGWARDTFQLNLRYGLSF
jgi:hypothetical protein